MIRSNKKHYITVKAGEVVCVAWCLKVELQNVKYLAVAPSVLQR